MLFNIMYKFWKVVASVDHLASPFQDGWLQLLSSLPFQKFYK